MGPFEDPLQQVVVPALTISIGKRQFSRRIKTINLADAGKIYCFYGYQAISIKHDADRLVEYYGSTCIRQETGPDVPLENLDAATVTASDQKELSVRSDIEVPWMNTRVPVTDFGQGSVSIDLKYRDSVILEPVAGI